MKYQSKIFLNIYFLNKSKKFHDVGTWKSVKAAAISRGQSANQVKISVVCPNLSSRKQIPKFSLGSNLTIDNFFKCKTQLSNPFLFLFTLSYIPLIESYFLDCLQKSFIFLWEILWCKCHLTYHTILHLLVPYYHSKYFKSSFYFKNILEITPTS